MAEETEYVTVRGVKIPLQQIRLLEDTFGAKLVPDSEWQLILALDTALRHYRAHYGHDPDLISVREDPFYWYKHMPIDIQVPLLNQPVPVYHKPAWFRLPRIFKVLKPNGQSKTAAKT